MSGDDFDDMDENIFNTLEAADEPEVAPTPQANGVTVKDEPVEAPAAVAEAPAAESDDDDDDDILTKRRKRPREEEVEEDETGFVFALLGKDEEHDEDDTDLAEKFNKMIWGSRVRPSLVKDMNRAVEKKLKGKQRVRRVQRQDDAEREARRMEKVQREMADLEALQTQTAQPVGDDAGDDEGSDAMSGGMNLSDEDEEGSEMDVEYNRDLIDARKFFGIGEEDELSQDAMDGDAPGTISKEELEAFELIKSKEQKEAERLENVIAPDDMKRLFLREQDKVIMDTDLPERYQLCLDSIGWTHQDVMDHLFSRRGATMLSRMATYIHQKAFRNSTAAIDGKDIEQIVEHIFKYANEPVFVQRYSLLSDVIAKGYTLDDVWAIWNHAFDFLRIFIRRADMLEELTPVHEALLDKLFRGAEDSPKWRGPTFQQKQDALVQAVNQNLDRQEAVAYEMVCVSFKDLTMAAGGGTSKWTWEPHYLTWMDKWITHWDDCFLSVTLRQKTQTAYRNTQSRQRLQLKRNNAVVLRSKQLYYYAMQWSAHPSALAHYLTSPANEYIMAAVTNKVDFGKLTDIEVDRVRGMQYGTSIVPDGMPTEMFKRMAEQLSTWKRELSFGTGHEAGLKLQKAQVEMLAGSLAMEPRFKQTLLHLMLGYEDQTVMGLGRFRVQPSGAGFGYFKQGGQSRIGYRNLCLKSRRFTPELKEEIVKYVENGLMVYWLEVDDPDAVREDIEAELQKTEQMTENQSISASSAVQSTLAGVQMMHNEVNRLNSKREELSTVMKLQSTNLWFPADQTFEEFKKSIKAQKVKVLTKVLRTAHRDHGELRTKQLAKLPFLPFDEFYTVPPTAAPGTPEYEAQAAWTQVRAEVLERAVDQALDDVEETIWEEIVAEVQEKVLIDSAASLRSIALRAGYQAYKLKGMADTAQMDAADKRMMLEEDLFRQKEEGDYTADHSDHTLPGHYRVAGVVYDDTTKQHTICFLDEYGNFLGSFELQHLVMREEDPLVRAKLDEMQVELRRAVFTHRPQAWALGMTHATDLSIREMLRKFNVDWHAMMEDSDLRNLLPPNFQPPKIEMVDARIARVWARSRAASVEYRDLNESQRKAVCIGRTLRSPLSCLASLFTADRDCLNLALTELQDIVPRLTLLRRLEQQMVSIVGIVGIDMNAVLKQMARSEHGLIQFLPGFGPRKAAALLRGVAGKSVTLHSRSDLLEAPFLMPPCVYRNVAGFVRVNLPLEEAHELEVARFRTTLDRTRVHPMFYQLVYQMLLSMLLSLDKVDKDKLASMDEEEYSAFMYKNTETMMFDLARARTNNDLDEALMMQIDWDLMKDNWTREYGQASRLVHQDHQEDEMVRGVKIADVMQVIREEMMEPFSLRAEAEDELYTMAEYRPTSEDIIFDVIVNDPTLQKGQVRIVTITDSTLSTVKVKIAGCDAARGIVHRTETVPGSKYNEAEWNAYRTEWFKRGMQYEAVVENIVKNSFMVRLSLLPEAVRDAKRKVDKSFKEMEKQLKNREATKKVGAGGTQQAMSQADTLSQTGTQLSVTDKLTASSLVESQFEVDEQVGGEQPGIIVPEAEGGSLNSHPLYMHDLRTSKEAHTLLTREIDGKPMYKYGDCILRPDVNAARNRFIMDMKVCDMNAWDSDNVLGAGPRESRIVPGVMQLKFELKGMHGGVGGVVAREYDAGGREVLEPYQDVDHMIHEMRLWKSRVDDLRKHAKFHDMPMALAKLDLVREVRELERRGESKSSTPWSIVPETLLYEQDPATGQPRLKKHSAMAPMRFYVLLPGASSQERREKRLRKWLFEVRRTHYALITCPDSSIRNPHRPLKDMAQVEDLFVEQYRKLLEQAAAKEGRIRRHASGATGSLRQDLQRTPAGLGAKPPSGSHRHLLAADPSPGAL